MPKQNPKKDRKAKPSETKLSPVSIVQPSVIKILEALGKGEVYSSALSRNQAVEMKKPIKDSGSESKKHSKVWIAKKTPINASPYEVVGQETVRLISPIEQPKTRFFWISDSIGVMSEKLPFKGIVKTNKKQNYSAAFLRGLGASTSISLFLNETDLKLDHLDAKTGMKIDGDWLFSSLISPEIFSKNSTITEQDLHALPYIAQYHAHYWLDQVIEFKKTKEALLFSNLTPEENKIIREGVNICIFHILLTPNSVLKDFVHAYINNQKNPRRCN